MRSENEMGHTARRLGDPVEAARAAGLRYVRETCFGFTRKRVGKGFCFLDMKGKPIRDKGHLGRIRHVQAIGYDAKGRKQYRYHAMYSGDVNTYPREIAGEDFTAKDFRTWAGTVQAAFELAGAGAVDSETAIKRNVAAAIKAVAGRLGNRPATCRKYYVHPVVLNAYADGTLFAFVKPPEGEFVPIADTLQVEEECVLRLIRKGIQSP
jgi:DNA topoisomerase IB